MTRSRLSRLAALGTATLSMIIASATPSSADSDKTVYLPGGRGYMKFHDNGDVFEVCDTKADGHGVAGMLWEKNQVTQNAKTVLVLEDGGDSGCAKKGHDIGNVYTYSMNISWNGGGGTYTSGWFNE
ncbi:hypothetical protein [Streptomyces chartreusis]